MVRFWPGCASLFTGFLAALALIAIGTNLPRAGESGGDTATEKAAPPEPAQYRTSEYRSPTPLTLQGATVVSGAEAMALWNVGRVRFIDVLPRARRPYNLPPETVWHIPQHLHIPGSVWLPNTGAGVLPQSAASYFQEQLQRLTNGDHTSPLLFYCLRDCWMSWNAAKRALALGYTSVYWFPEGTDGWTEIGGKLEPATAEPVPEPAD
jgi:PQQ-dependent catabolism-associated CXXCW motif protein